jgi:integrase
MHASLDEGLHTNTEFQRKKFKIITEESDTIYLTEDEIDRIYNLDFSKNLQLEKVRDLLIVAVRTALRFSDLIKINENNVIRKDENYYIRIHTQKAQEEVFIPLKRQVVEVLKKYNNKLPREITNQKMNEYLNEIGEKAEINSIETKITTKGGLRIEETLKNGSF